MEQHKHKDHEPAAAAPHKPATDPAATDLKAGDILFCPHCKMAHKALDFKGQTGRHVCRNCGKSFDVPTAMNSRQKDHEEHHRKKKAK